MCPDPVGWNSPFLRLLHFHLTQFAACCKHPNRSGRRGALAIIACVDRITMNADCFGHVGLVAGAGYPIPYEAISNCRA